MVGADNNNNNSNKMYRTIFVTIHPHNISCVTSLIEVFPLCDVQTVLLNALCCYCRLVMDSRDRVLCTSPHLTK
jgi:hypothetical protein